MRKRAALAIWLAFAATLHAHRTEGLLQASLVEVLPSQVGVEVTFVVGIDIAPKVVALLDGNGDGVFSEDESGAWSARFMAAQSVAVNGKTLPLKVGGVRASPLAEMTGGHGEIVALFTADLGELARGPRTIVCTNRYEPIPCIYQTNGLVPKAPGVRIRSHRQDERQQALTLAAEFSSPPASAIGTADTIPQTRSAKAIQWLIGLSIAGAAAAIGERRRRSAKAEL